MKKEKRCDDLIYGVDKGKNVTSIMVRDAIIKCFLAAHNEALDEERRGVVGKKEGESTKSFEVEGLIKKCFSDVGGDFENPTKEDLENVVLELKKYASHFRNEKKIEKHACEIMSLVRKIEEDV